MVSGSVATFVTQSSDKVWIRDFFYAHSLCTTKIPSNSKAEGNIKKLNEKLANYFVNVRQLVHVQFGIYVHTTYNLYTIAVDKFLLRKKKR